MGTGRSRARSLASLPFGPRPLPGTRPIPFGLVCGDALAPGPPEASRALPAAARSVDPLADPLPAPALTFHPSSPPGHAGASGLAALQADRRWLAVRSRASVRSLQLLGRQTGHGAPGPAASPPTPSPGSPLGRLTPPIHPRGSGSLATRGAARRQPRPWAVSLGGSGPGLLASGRACQFRPLPRGGRAIPARRFDIRDSSVQSGPAQCQFGARGSGLPVQPLSLGPCQLCPTPGLLASPPAPPAASRGSGPLAHLVSVCTLSSPVSQGIHAPTQESDFQCPGLGLAPGLSASPPAPPSRWAAPARCWR